MVRIGEGYDVHKLIKGRKLVLGGVLIPYEYGLLGHSDADVLIHAIIDSLLGAMAIGDIGKFFSDKDDKYKNIKSTILLSKIKEYLSGDNEYHKKYKINNIDATVICERPKLRMYIDDMRKVISDILCINIDCINIKATTEEGLGFTGKGEGISARAVCLIEDEDI